MILFRSLKRGQHSCGQYLTFIMLVSDRAASIPPPLAMLMLPRGKY